MLRTSLKQGCPSFMISQFTESAYIDFLVASPRVYSCTEAARVQPEGGHLVAHDRINRFLYRQQGTPEMHWQEAQSQVTRTRGILVLDDSTLDKPYAHRIELVYRQWSGKHHRVVQGINLITLLWSDGDRHVPVDWRVYDKPHDHATKNDHFTTMVQTAHARGFTPECVAFDSWYASLANLKQVGRYQWIWLTRFKSNRLVNPDDTGNRAIGAIDLPAEGRVVHLKGYGFIKVFKRVAPDGDIEYWATNDLSMPELQRLQYAQYANTIEQYHRGIKQFCGIERCQVRGARAQRAHIGLALRAFLRIESYCFHTGISWFTAKFQIIRNAVRSYLAQPKYFLFGSA